MATEVTLKLEGFETYLAELVKAGQDIDRVVEQCLEAGADVLVEGMKRRAPQEHIRAVIRRTIVRHDGNKQYAYIGVLHGTPLDLAARAATWEFGGNKEPNKARSTVRKYDTRKGKKGTVIEYKTKQRIHRPNLQAHPYIRPTLRNDSKKARAAMEEVFQDWLKK